MSFYNHVCPYYPKGETKIDHWVRNIVNIDRNEQWWNTRSFTVVICLNDLRASRYMSSVSTTLQTKVGYILCTIKLYRHNHSDII